MPTVKDTIVVSGSMPLSVKPPAGWGVTGTADWFVKDGRMHGVVKLRSTSGEEIYISASTSLASVEKVVNTYAARQGVELGWSPFKSIKKATRAISKVAKKRVGRKLQNIVHHPAFSDMASSISRGASKIGKGTLAVLKNPQVQQLALAAAPIALSAFGVPPTITAMGMGVLQQAMQGNPEDMGKIENIANLAAQGDVAGMQMHDVMKLLYRGGMSQLGPQGAAPMMPQQIAQMMPQMPQTLQRMMPQQMPRMSQQMPRMPQQMPQMPQLPPWMMQQRYMPYMPPSPYNFPYAPTSPMPGMFPFQARMPGGYKVSGWTYNVPYRPVATSPVMSAYAKGMGQEGAVVSPMRSLYTKGMQPTVGNWLYNKPYRSNLEALELDKSNPRHIARGMYSKGMVG